MTKSKKKSTPVRSIWLTLLGFMVLGLIMAVLLRGKDIMLLNPKGYIAGEQLKLLIIATLIMLIIGIPALFFFYFFAWKYRETNEKAAPHPDVGQGKFSAFLIWAFPTFIAILLAILLVPATHRLEPQKPVLNAEDPMTVQVVALRWKWLFIYPEHDIATVNFVQIPEDTPIEFELTADETPMSSFWIPHLGGMLYAMTEHVNSLNLIADTPGDYEGSAAEINGSGFAGMRFNTRVSTLADFEKWVNETRANSIDLSSAEYLKLLVPSKDNPTAFYANPSPDLYSTILGKYAGAHDNNSETHEGHE